MDRLHNRLIFFTFVAVMFFCGFWMGQKPDEPVFSPTAPTSQISRSDFPLLDELGWKTYRLESVVVLSELPHLDNKIGYPKVEVFTSSGESLVVYLRLPFVRLQRGDKVWLARNLAEGNSDPAWIVRVK